MAAEGAVDGYWEYRLKPWDMAAGVLIFTEAGGHVTTMDGGPFSVFDRSILAVGPKLYPRVLEKTRPSVETLLSEGVDLSRWFVPEGYTALGDIPTE